MTTLPQDNGTAGLPIGLRRMTSDYFAASNTGRPILAVAEEMIE